MKNTPLLQPASEKSMLTPADLARLTDKVRTEAKSAAAKIPLLGSVVWLLMQQAGTRHGLLSDMEWRVMPPLLLEQSRVYARDDMPIAFVSWARLSEDVALRYRAPPHRLSPADWRSGHQIWLVDVVTPFGGSVELLEDLRHKVFPGKPVLQLGEVHNGLAGVLDWSNRDSSAAVL